ncbi:hypothetical protein [Streptomyces sp. NPDC051993]|uniref:hypothetical protein n=1 Tax=Streptomyces sp. NPDC051993 TaxID=3155286 RepID=UPI0034271575
MVRHEGLEALKVGVASISTSESRLRDHERQGWTTECTVNFKTGHQALQAERAVLGFLRACGATSRVPQMDMPQGGYTETIARPELVELRSTDLVQIAELAGRVIDTAHCPLRQVVRSHVELGDLVFTLFRHGHTEQARRLGEQVVPLLEDLLEKLGPTPSTVSTAPGGGQPLPG